MVGRRMACMVLVEHMAACHNECDDSGCALYPRVPQPGERRWYPEDLYGPPPHLPHAPCYACGLACLGDQGGN